MEAAASGAIDEDCRTIKKLHSLRPRTPFWVAIAADEFRRHATTGVEFASGIMAPPYG